MPDLTDRETVTCPELARFCRVCPRTIHNWTKRGIIQAHRGIIGPGRGTTYRFTFATAATLIRSLGLKLPKELQRALEGQQDATGA